MSPLRSSAGPGCLHERRRPARRRRSVRARSCRGRAVRRAARGRARRRARWPPRSRPRAAPCSWRLPDELVEAPGPQRDLELVLGGEVGRLDALGDAHRASAPCRVARSAAPSSSSAVSPSAPASRRSASGAAKPSSSSPSRASSRGSAVAAPAPHDDLLAHLRPDLLAQLDDDPLRGALADTGDRLEEARVAAGDRPQHGADRPGAQDRERKLRPDRLHAQQHQEEIALGGRREPDEHERVVAHDQVRVERRLRADRRQLCERLRRHGEAVADTAAQQRHVLGAALGDLAAQQRDHPASAAIAWASGAWFAWQIATASASEAWSEDGARREREQRGDHPRHLVLRRATRSRRRRP